jgi:hypothetical protein
MENEKEYLLGSKTPKEWIERSLEVSLTSGTKAILAKQWLKSKKDKWTVKDIEYARNRNEYWKSIKTAGYKQRNNIRFAKYNFLEKRKVWDSYTNKLFINIQLNKKDHELAKQFNTTIPGIQYRRRKLSMSRKIIDKYSQYNIDILDLMSISEKRLREMVKKTKEIKEFVDKIYYT